MHPIISYNINYDYGYSFNNTMMEYNCIIGIDPGANGGIAVDAEGRVSVCKMPKVISKLGDFLRYYKDNYSPVVFIEKLAIRHDDLQGGKVFRIKSMIANYEQLKAVISLCGIDICEVHPLTWQSRLGLRKIGEEKQARKRRYKDVASGLYPSVPPTMWNCDALLIMRYGKTIINSIQKKDIKWVRENLIINKNDDIYNYIY